MYVYVFSVTAKLLKALTGTASAAEMKVDARIYKARLDTRVGHVLIGDFGVSSEILAFAIKRCFSIFRMSTIHYY